MKLHRIAQVFGFIGLFAACGGGNDAPTTLCVPGATTACVCAGGGSGAQACLGDGNGYAACECGSSGADAGEPEDMGVVEPRDMGTTPYVCGPTNCAGCCAGNVCQTSSNTFCGSGGGVCAGCGTNERCEVGICRPFCDPTNCDGCCSGTTCLPGRADDACGADGLACADCGINECGASVCRIPDDSRWDVVLVDLTVSTTTLSGAAWDAGGGAPDLFVTARHTSDTGPFANSGVRSDSFTATFTSTPILANVTAANLRSGLRFDVYDEDLTANDVIGACRHNVESSGAFDGDTKTINCPREAATGNAGFTLRFKLVRR